MFSDISAWFYKGFAGINPDLVSEVILPFLERISVKYGYDYSDYQLKSIARRIKKCSLYMLIGLLEKIRGKFMSKA